MSSERPLPPVTPKLGTIVQFKDQLWVVRERLSVRRVALEYVCAVGDVTMATEATLGEDLVPTNG